MKLICIGRNYSEHAKELNNPVPENPVFFMKPDTALLLKNRPFYIPEFSNEVHHEVEVVVKINRIGKHIDEKFAHRYYDEIGLGVDFTARDIQQKCKEKGLPWEIAKAFDYSAPLGEFIPVDKLPDVKAINFELLKNGKTVQKGNTSDMLFSIDQIISYVSKYVTLKIGDLIYTGTPSGVGPVAIGDKLTGKLEGEVMFDFEVR
ncbi:MAG: fumarylacetoacetate hydrolase family protein [Bacteroidales bacterium]|nr:fumarylacetoacetate hydrolase family protein [Bacteroidales bacterium]MBN2819616.1 fumarylacetoacetate hydrolase family protein [Bacteroidales bacterium]